MQVNFKELKVETSIGEYTLIDVRKDLGNKLHLAASDIETFDLGHKIYHSDGDIEITDSEYDALIRILQVTGTTMVFLKAIEALKI